MKLEVRFLGLKDYIRFALIIISLPIWLPLGILLMITCFGVIQPIKGYFLRMQIQSEWYPKNKYLLFVYSESPVWKEYIETNILPRISELGIILNWSERSKWAWNSNKFEVKVFKYWANVSLFKKNGKKELQGYEYNPIAIVFTPGNKVKVFRFWKAFKDYKHGKTIPLKKVENELFESIDYIKKMTTSMSVD